MKRSMFAPGVRFHLVDELGAAGDFQVERRSTDGRRAATSIDGTSNRIFTQFELRVALAEYSLRFHLDGRHVDTAAAGQPPIAPQEPDFSGLAAKHRELAQRRFDVIRPLLRMPQRTAADVREQARAAGVNERTLWNWLRWY